jgi:BirA family transcriptional regulator, biotin operon repressor / biotin---[acetyl-CoA-carboxylase] ligase
MANYPPLAVDRLRAMLPIGNVGQLLIYEPVIPSTNSLALSHLESGKASDGAVVLTDEQPAGRGRQGREWVTLPRQQILMSIILDVPFAPHLAAMMAGVAAYDALTKQGIPREQLGIKWPNDILIDGSKVAGILIETRTVADRLYAVIGIGMNVNGSLSPWSEIAQRATTLEDALGEPFARESIIIAFLTELATWHSQIIADAGNKSAVALWQSWRDAQALLGQPITVHQGETIIRGNAEVVMPDGSLMVRLSDGTSVSITWGDVW